MSRVWPRIAGTSDATKYSSLPRPITTGGPSRAATILYGSRRQSTESAKTPRNCFTAWRTACSRLPSKFLDQMGDDFSVGLGFENMAFRLELLLERQIVFDDAVVNHDDIARAIAVRMRVFLGGSAVRRPAGVADAVAAIDGVNLQDVFQIAQLAGSAAHAESLIVAGKRRCPPNRSPGIRGASGHPK